ncbi:DUF6196 family protein [Nocardia halotolerans]|uniref:DUF6196 family protein n=1 Tax=Nocardia halotolerans TaxID=1755878 RepID=A0ABV8VDN7_9NOCA
MVGVSMETAQQTEQRLRRVIAEADLVVHDGVWSFDEFPADQPPALTSETLAVVRDQESWSRLAPLDPEREGVERFGIFSFHFAENLDNSGFVGWLATHLKTELGTGVFVVCGSNRTRGGIYDYWGCPIDLLDQAVAVVDALRRTGPAAPAASPPGISPPRDQGGR